MWLGMLFYEGILIPFIILITIITEKRIARWKYFLKKEDHLMKEARFPMTEAGLKKLKKELVELQSVRLEKAKERIKRARMFCDFNEDSEYEAALGELAMITKRVATVEEMILYAEIIEVRGESTVELGNTVTIQEIPDGEKETYTIVGIDEADPFEGKISYQAPIAKSMLGAKLNEEVEVKLPNGNRRIKIIALS